MEERPRSFWDNPGTIPSVLILSMGWRHGRLVEKSLYFKPAKPPTCGAAQPKVRVVQQTGQSDSSPKDFQSGSESSLTISLLEFCWNMLGLEWEIPDGFLEINMLVHYPEAGLHLISNFKWLFSKIITWHFWVKHRLRNPASFSMNKQISLIKYVVSSNYSGYFRKL